MLFLLDTDLLTLLRHRSQPEYDRIQAQRQNHPNDTIGTTVVSFQEQTQGWLSFISQARVAGRIVYGYQELLGVLNQFAALQVVVFDQAAQDQFDDLRRQGVRIGTMDLRIASIALVHGATVLTRNLRDFRQVPGLAVEDWTV